MTTRYARPPGSRKAVFDRRWFALPALLMALGGSLVLLWGGGPDATPEPPEAAAGRASLPPAA